MTEPQKSTPKQKTTPEKKTTSKPQTVPKQKKVEKQKPQPRPKQKTPSAQNTETTSMLKQQLNSTKANVSGLIFEQNVANYFREHGWNPQLRVEMLGYEFDLFEEHIVNGGQKIYLLVECKHKRMIDAKDIVHFMAKVAIFSEKFSTTYSRPQVRAYFCFTGEFDEEAAYVAKNFNPPVQMVKLQG
jgi:restriction endonuclease Mrr